MTYLIAQLWWRLLFALAGGLAAGWLLRGSLVRDRRREWEARLADAQASIDVKESETTAAVESAIVAGEQLEEREAEVRALRAELADCRRSRAVAPEDRDDLKRIRGIGPVLEQRLQSLGVRHFRQIAEWTPAEIAYFAEKLRDFTDRIQRDNWVGSAADEHGKKYGEARRAAS